MTANLRIQMPALRTVLGGTLRRLLTALVAATCGLAALGAVALDSAFQHWASQNSATSDSARLRADDELPAARDAAVTAASFASPSAARIVSDPASVESNVAPNAAGDAGGASIETVATETPRVSDCCRDRDELWILSSRSLACGDYDSLVFRLGVSRRDACGVWRPAALTDFLAAQDPALTTCIFVHGNRVEACEDRRLAALVYDGLTQCSPDRPLRFVFWSWPTDKIPRHPLEDVRAKAARTCIDAHLLARVLAHSSADSPASLAGFSFGARIITGALHLCGGGAVGGATLSAESFRPHGPYRAVLLAAAVDNDALLPGRMHGRALSQVDRMLVVTNCGDAALKRYRLIYDRKSGAEALGSTGPAGVGSLGGDRAKLACFDACSLIGKTHDMPPYVQSRAVVGRAMPYLFPADE